MVIPHQTITGVSGLGANAPGVLRRTAERIPDQLKFSATIDATPIRWLPPIVRVAYFPTAHFRPTFRPADTRSREASCSSRDAQ
jgi:hypothetical protein